MNKQEYLIITFHSLDDAMDLDAKQTSSMKGRLIPKPSVIDAGCGMCFSCQNKDMDKWKIFLEENQNQLGVWLSDGNPYCPAQYMTSTETKWSCPINLSWESYSPNEIAGSYPYFAFVDKETLKCTITANYDTVVEFDLSDYLE